MHRSGSHQCLSLTQIRGDSEARRQECESAPAADSKDNYLLHFHERTHIMTTQHKGLWTIVTVSIGILMGIGATVWMIPLPPMPETHAQVDSRNDQQLVNIEQAITVL